MENKNTKLEQVIGMLNQAQRDATLNLSGPELIVAGAGSGKTSVLTTRIALLLQTGVPPQRILALTFTKKAADEMKKRIVALHGNEAKHICMGTFHSIFIRMIRPYAGRLGFPENFTILDEEDSTSVLKKCITAVTTAGFPQEDKRTAADNSRIKELDKHYKPKTVKGIISNAKNELITADMYAMNKDLTNRDSFNKRPLVHKIFKLYRDTCFRMGMMDFDDILLYTDMLLANNPDVLSEIAASFDHILVDEYQDTNTAQYSILRRLTYINKNICVVGDDSQSIYAFRGAKVENIMNFTKDYPGCKVYKLEQNYRSTKTIVEAANKLISNNENRIPKICFSKTKEDSPIILKELDTEKGEADYVASDILSTMKYNSNLKYKDFAILYRTNSQSRAIEDALIKKGIPYIIYSGTSFFERMEIKDVMAYFKLAVNPNDDISFRRVANKPARFIGEATMNNLMQLAEYHGTSLWQLVNMPEFEFCDIPGKALNGLMNFRDTVNECIQLAASMTAYGAATRICDLTGFYKEYMESPDEESQRRADNIRELVDSVKSYEEDQTENGTVILADYLQGTMLLSNADTGNKKDDNKVNLMTVHCAKGLEYHNVYVTGMEEELFPLSIEGTISEEEEERRLFYVAVTRAKRKLTLLKADNRLKFGKRNSTRLSHFIPELLPECFETEEEYDGENPYAI